MTSDYVLLALGLMFLLAACFVLTFAGGAAIAHRRKRNSRSRRLGQLLRLHHPEWN